MRLLLWLAHALLGVGLCAPCMTVTPRMEPLGRLGEWLGLVKAPETYSVLTGILALLRGGNVLVGVALLFFSILFPVAKLVAIRVGTHEGTTPLWAQRLGKYSMVDVFVLALLVVASKSFPGGTTVELRWGAYAFAAAALLTMGATRK